MKGIFNRLLDKWTGVFLYRLLQKWELNSYQLQAKDDYRDFVILHCNRLASMLVVLQGGPMKDNLYRASNEVFKDNKVVEEILDYLASASRDDPIMTAAFSRDYERLRAFWQGALVAELTPDLEDFLGSSLRKSYIDSAAKAIYLSAAYFSVYYDLIASKPDCRALLCPDNNAITDFADAQFFFSGDILRPLSYLWGQGVSLGRRYKWQDGFTNENAEDFYEAVTQLLNTTTDYVAKTNFMKILAVGAEGHLVSVLKRATWHDRQDEGKKRMAKKRQPREPDIVTSELTSRCCRSLSVDDALARQKASAKQDPTSIQDEFRDELYEMANLEQLTDRERQVFYLKISGIEEEGEIPTNRKIAQKMGISEARVSQLFDDACQKLRGHYSSMDS